MIGPLNLASRPFRNERLPALALSVAIVLLLGLGLKQGLVVADLLSPRSVELEREVRALDAEAASLRAERANLAPPKPDPAAVQQWAFVGNLVDRRAFSWTDLLARLEEVLPPGVHLVSIAPLIESGQVKLDFTAVARTHEDALEFVRVLQSRKDFADVFPTGLDDGTGEGHELNISLHYVPKGRVPVAFKGRR